MSIETDADRLNTLKTLGALVELANGEDSWPVYATIDRDYVAVDEIESYRPIMTCRLSDTNTPALGIVLRGTTVQADEGNFKVVGIQPDGTGMVALILEET